MLRKIPILFALIMALLMVHVFGAVDVYDSRTSTIDAPGAVDVDGDAPRPAPIRRIRQHKRVIEHDNDVDDGIDHLEDVAEDKKVEPMHWGYGGYGRGWGGYGGYGGWGGYGRGYGGWGGYGGYGYGRPWGGYGGYGWGRRW